MQQQLSVLLKTGLIAGSTLLITACSGYGDYSQNTNSGDLYGGSAKAAKVEKKAVQVVIPANTVSTAIGNVLAAEDANKTLYTFTKDSGGGSNCNGGCASVWPPLVAKAKQSQGDFTTVVRDDSSLQWAFKGDPLYFYVGDTQEGDTNGEGLNGVWFVARP